MVELRNYKPEDYTQIRTNLEVAKLFWGDMDSKELLERVVKRDSESIVVAEDKGRIVGSAYFVDMGFAAMLWRLNVVPEYRKTGLGKQIVDEVRKRAKSRGFTQIHFIVHEEQEKLRDWYKESGAWEGNLYRWMGSDL